MEELTGREEERLRLALGLIGDAAAHPDPGRPRERGTSWFRRPAVVAAGLAAAVLCGVLLAVDRGPRKEAAGGTGDEGGDGQGQTAPEYVACARLIVEGDVVAVRRAGTAGRVLVTFAVQEWIKPASGDRQVELDLVDPAVAEVREPFRTGQHVLLVVPVREDQEADAFSGAESARTRKVIETHWDEAARTECPPYWKNPQD